MLRRFNVKNFMSFSEKENGYSEEFSMIPGNARYKKNHLYISDSEKILKFAAIYGANASGKSNIVKALAFMRRVVVSGIPKKYTEKYCRTDIANRNKPSYFEVEVSLEDQVYTYGFEIILSQSRILSEWLVEIGPDNSERELFTRDVEAGTWEVGGWKTNHRLSIQLDMLAQLVAEDSSILFLSEMNRNKRKFYENSPDAKILQQLFCWFQQSLMINFPDEPVSDYSYLGKADNVEKICEFIAAFGTGITDYKFEDISKERVFEVLPDSGREELENWQERTSIETERNSDEAERTSDEVERTSDESGSTSDETKCASIETEHISVDSENISEESANTAANPENIAANPESAASESVATESVATESVATESVASESVATESVASESAPTKSSASESASSEFSASDSASPAPAHSPDENSRNHSRSIRMVFRSRAEFFIVTLRKGEAPKYQTIRFYHENREFTFGMNEESDGTIRLLGLLEVLLAEQGKTYVIDELDRCLHPCLTYKFIETFLNSLQDKKIQLIVTTHESRLLDFDLLRRDEIWFVDKKRNGESDIYSLEEYNTRLDYKIDKAYLEGRYGGVPVFTTIFPVGE